MFLIVFQAKIFLNAIHILGQNIKKSYFLVIDEFLGCLSHQSYALQQ